MGRKKNSMPGVRVFSYSVAGVLGLLMISTTAPSLIVDSSERALVDAPVRLLTSPIKGSVSELALRVGDPIRAGETLAVVRNDSVNKDQLITLQLTRENVESEVAVHKDAIAASKATEAQLQVSIDRQSQALTRQFDEEIAGASASVSVAQSELAVAKDHRDRKSKLIQRGVAGGGLVDMQGDVDAASSSIEQARSSLSAAEARLASAQDGVFLGPNAAQVNALQDDLRRVRRERTQFEYELAGLQAKLPNVQKLIDLEQSRLDRLSDRRIVAETSGEIYAIASPNGAAVSDGDTLAQAIDCNHAFVAAIFSERKAQNLTPGAKVTVTADSWKAPVHGTIRSLMPRTTTVDDAQYAVPFPPTERRELYALIDFDTAAKTVAEPSVISRSRQGTCDVGTWVSVSIDDGTIPSLKQMGQVATRIGEKAAVLASDGFSAARPVLVDLAESVGRTTGSLLASLREMVSSNVAEARARHVERLPKVRLSGAPEMAEPKTDRLAGRMDPSLSQGTKHEYANGR